MHKLFLLFYDDKLPNYSLTLLVCHSTAISVTVLSHPLILQADLTKTVFMLMMPLSIG